MSKGVFLFQTVMKLYVCTLHTSLLNLETFFLVLCLRKGQLSVPVRLDTSNGPSSLPPNFGPASHLRMALLLHNP